MERSDIRVACAQFIDFAGQQITSPIKEIDREKVRSAWDEKTTIARH